MSTFPLVSPGTKSAASDAKAMYRPSALMDGSSATTWSPAMETNAVAGVQPDGTPVHISRKYNLIPPGCKRPGTRLLARERKTTYRPPILTLAPKLSPFAALPSLATETIVLEGEQDPAAAWQES